MAISNSDGSIVLNTQVNTDGITKGMQSINGAITGVSGSVKKLAVAVTGAFAVKKMADFVKASVDAYGEYEQLVGGVETLFKEASQKVIDYATDAFYTAGVSANEYMQQVTSFSASLISSCAGDTDKAADIANMALIDISDNVNKMGSSMESVTLAYQGFAKQQYMLLDNLKLGYGGTKTEMQRLLKDAQAITGVKYDIDNLADVYNALHVIQEQLGITGTTAKEAEETIQGSANMMKASWENVIAAISGGGDLDMAINNLVYSITKYFDNIVPVVQRALVGVGQLIEKVAPMLVQNVASALIQAIPDLVNAIYQMIIGLAKGIWDGIRALFSGDMSGASEVTAQLKTATTGVADDIQAAADSQDALTDNVEDTNKELKKTLAGFDDLQILTDNTSNASAAEASITANNISNDIADQTLDIGEGIQEIEVPITVNTSPFEKLLQIVVEIKDIFMSGFWESFQNADFKTDFSKIATAIEEIKNSLIGIWTSSEVTTAMQTFGTSFVYALGQITGSVLSIGTTIATNLLGGFNQYLSTNTPFIQQSIAKMFDAGASIYESVGNLWSAFANIFSVFADENGIDLTSNIIGIFANAALGLSTLALEMGADFINFLVQPITDNQEGIKEALDGVLKFFSDITESIKELIDDLVSSAVSMYEEHVQPLVQTVTDVVSDVVETFLDAWQEYVQPVLDEVSEKFNEVVNEHIIPMFEKIREFAGKVYDFLQPIVDKVLRPIAKFITERFVVAFSNGFEYISSIVMTVISTISDTIGGIYDVLNGVIDFITGVFTGDFDKAFGGIEETFSGILNTLSSLLGGAINLIIDIINGFVSGINAAIELINKIPGVEIPELSKLQHVEIPKLAKGTVLPGGDPFVAIVNDNPRGKPNIEAPAELIKQMVNEALDEKGITGGQQQQIIKEEHYNLNQTELMTIMYKLVKGGERLNGTSLVKQGGI